MGYIFVTYAEEDHEYAHQLAAHLTSMGYDTWIDEDHTESKSHYDATKSAIEKCACYLLIISPEGNSSRRVLDELSTATQNNKPVLGLQLSGNRWNLLKDIPCEEVSNAQMPSAEFITAHLSQHIANGPEPGKWLALSNVENHEDAGMTSLSRPEAFRQLTDVFRATINKNRGEKDKE